MSDDVSTSVRPEEALPGAARLLRGAHVQLLPEEVQAELPPQKTHLAMSFSCDTECKLCHKQFGRTYELRRHNREQHSPQKYTCLYCNKNMKRAYLYKQHMALNHSSTFQCVSCDRNYKSKTALNRHIRYDCGKEPLFQCAHCVYRAYQKIHLRKHLAKLHDGQRYYCPNCCKGYKNHKTMRYHVTQDCGKSKKFVCKYPCPKCERVYSHHTSRNRHLKYECGKEPTFSCSSCPYIAKRIGHLKTHMTRKHHITFCGTKIIKTEKVPNLLGQGCGRFACPRCPKIYKHQQSRNTHLKYECGKNPQFPCEIPFWPLVARGGGTEIVFTCTQCSFPCPQCNRNYATISTRNRHLKFECGKLPTFKCTFCPYITKRKCSLKTHTHIKHPFVASSIYPCPLCPRHYSTVASRNRHVKFECGKKPSFRCEAPGCSYVAKRKNKSNYPCPNCNRLYSHAGTRSRHVKYECGKQPSFKCPIPPCSYSARRKSTLKVHVIHKHGFKYQNFVT
ncbi:zinc finger protein 425-like [Zophobas morio]|uniref:zinc finger protein 425-like n=1 Tax=Zophobas morio TaxID=2755281 RepID=UPI003082FE32